MLHIETKVGPFSVTINLYQEITVQKKKPCLNIRATDDPVK